MLVAAIRPTCTVMSLRSAKVRSEAGSTKRNIFRVATPLMRFAIDVSNSTLPSVLGQIQAGSVARNVVRPVRWEVQIFGFRTMSLDLRQNTTVVNRVLAELYAKLTVGSRKSQPEPGSAEWLKWIMAELKKPMPWVPLFKNLSDEARELIDLLTLVRERIRLGTVRWNPFGRNRL